MSSARSPDACGALGRHRDLEPVGLVGVERQRGLVPTSRAAPTEMSTRTCAGERQREPGAGEAVGDDDGAQQVGLAGDVVEDAYDDQQLVVDEDGGLVVDRSTFSRWAAPGPSTATGSPR